MEIGFRVEAPGLTTARIARQQVRGNLQTLQIEVTTVVKRILCCRSQQLVEQEQRGNTGPASRTNERRRRPRHILACKLVADLFEDLGILEDVDSGPRRLRAAPLQ